MDNFDRKAHWENIYTTKNLHEVSWYQPTPTTSLDFLHEYKIPLTAKIIDIGGGDSLLVDNLLALGYQDITVLDISAKAIERAKQRLGEKQHSVKWIVADAATFEPIEQYDFWHDRAAFHFLTHQEEIQQYISTANRYLAPNGVFVVGTFSEEGPKKCSGIEIKQYSEDTLTKLLQQYFKKIKCITTDHLTPSNTLQNFVFCSFKKLAVA